MTNVKLAGILPALILSAIAIMTASAEARTRHTQEIAVEFDRHDVRGYVSVGGIKLSSLPSGRGDRAKRKVRQRHHTKPTVIAKRDHVVVAKSGARASVSIVARPHFVCLIEKLEATGYKIDFMGGYAERGNSSAHPTGNALDINQTGRNAITRRLPAGVSQMASACGLVHGGGWLSHPDQGHFEMPRKYGYIYRTHRTRLARAH